MIEIVHKDGEPGKSSKFVMMIRASESNLVKAPDSTKATSLIVKRVTEKLSSFNLKPSVLVMKGLSQDIGKSQESPKVVVSGVLIFDTKAVPWNYKQVIVTYKGKEVEEEVNETGGLTNSGRCFTPEELRKSKPFKDSQIPVKKPVTKEEAEEFLRKTKAHDYSIVEQLRKTPAQIFLLSLLIHSDEHRRALMKILNEAHVPDKITVNHLENIANKIFEANRITFSDDELPLKGTEHNRALYLIVKCGDSVVSRVPEGKCIPGPTLPSASVMVANEMLKNGFVSGKGLGSSLHGIVDPVRPSGNLCTFGAKKPPTSIVPKPVVDVDEELIKRFQSLFDEVNMVEVGEGSSKANVQLVGPNVKLSNWEATPLPTRKEFYSFYAGCNDMTCMRNFQTSLKSQSNPEIIIQEVEYDDETEYEEEAAFEEIDDVIIKSKKQPDHVKDLRKFFQRLRRYNLKLNPAKCAFGVLFGKLLGFVVSQCGIELDPLKIKAIQELPLPKNKIEVMSLLGRLNYISRFIAQLTTTCEPIFKLLKKNVAVKWTDECQKAFDKIKRYLLNPSMLVPPEPGRPLILYLTILDNSFGCVLGQHDITGRYHKRMARAYNKKVRPWKFEVGQMVLKRILPHHVEAKGNFVPNCQGPFVVTRVLPNGALYLTDIEGKCVDMTINSDAVKRDPSWGKHGSGARNFVLSARILQEESMA
ncbi:uncharacterized protein [Nicotiana sylvestris]|uniref:uncharacterized protein n=1 Tax=Nicotiana sylvestris TaxID=4096 RepID=UPI00388CC7E9